MAAYMPILKGRDAEFMAVSHLPEPVFPSLLPLFEVVPEVEGPVRASINFGARVRERLPARLAIAVDVHYLPELPEGQRGPMRGIAEELEAQRVSMLPVARLEDGKDRSADVGYAAEVHDCGAVLRLGGEVNDPDDVEAEQHLHRLQDYAGLEVEQVHLLLDMFEVRSGRDAIRAEPVARKCVSWARRYPWKSITVAAGAMPASISDLPVHSPEPLPRWDLQLWTRIRDLGVRYGDYAIAHPQMTSGGWRPMPSLRYADDTCWWIYRWQQDKLAKPAMYDLCRSLVLSDQWEAGRPELSWGDEQIAARAADRAGPGNATSWRAWSTSHHIAHVTRQLVDLAAQA
jgi:Beta protein